MSARPWGRSKVSVREDVMALGRRRKGMQEDSRRIVGFERPGKEFSFYFFKEKNNIGFKVFNIGILL